MWKFFNSNEVCNQMGSNKIMPLCLKKKKKNQFNWKKSFNFILTLLEICDMHVGTIFTPLVIMISLSLSLSLSLIVC